MATERRPVQEATRGIALLAGIAVGVIAIATLVAAIAVAFVG